MDSRAETPLISVIMPIFNGERFLSATLDSLLAQSYPHWEAICVDDVSTDGSRDILTAYAAKDPRFRLFLSGRKRNGRTLGLERMQGQYFTFLDQDDLYSPWTLEHRIQAALQSGADIVEDEVRMFDDGTEHMLPSAPDAVTVVSSPLAITDANAVIRHAAPWWALVWNKLYGVRFRSVRQTPCPFGDLSFNLNCLAIGGTMAYVSGYSVGYRQHSASFMHVEGSRLRYEIGWLRVLPSQVDALPASVQECAWQIVDWLIAQCAEGFVQWTKPKRASRIQRYELCWAFWRYFLAGGLRLRHLSFVDRFCFRLFALTGWRRPLRWMKFKPGLTAWRENQLCIGATEPLA